MIYILVGNNQKEKKAALQKHIGNNEHVVLAGVTLQKEVVRNFATETPLFGKPPAVVIEQMLSRADLVLDKEDLELLAEVSTIFIFLEDKLLKAEETKYKKYATIERFEEKKEKATPVTNVFAIADAFCRKDKVTTWILYREAVEKGTEPEAISGMLFWKIRQMILASPKSPYVNELKQMSGELVTLYHRSHKGECDFVVGLEQFILSSLSR